MNEENHLPETAHGLEDIQPLLDRAQRGDESVLPELRRLLDEHPEIWRHAGDLARHAEQALLTLITGTDLFGQVAIRHKLAEIKTEVGGPSPSPLEKLLTERIAISWLAVHQGEIELSDVRQRHPGNTALADQARKRLDSAHKRYLYSIKQLAVVRKLLKPALSPLQLIGADLADRASARRPRRVSVPAAAN